MTRQWAGRLTLSAAVFVGVYVVLRLQSNEPELGGLLLLGAVCAAMVWLVLDVLVDSRPVWMIDADPPTTPPQLDPRLATHVRILEHHLTSAAPDAALRDSLARLARDRLSQRRGLHPDDAEARELLGPELLSVIDGSTRRISLTELDRHVRRLEEL